MSATQTETVLNFIHELPLETFDDAPISWGGFIMVCGYSYLLHDIRTIVFVIVC